MNLRVLACALIGATLAAPSCKKDQEGAAEPGLSAAFVTPFTFFGAFDLTRVTDAESSVPAGAEASAAQRGAVAATVLVLRAPSAGVSRAYTESGDVVCLPERDVSDLDGVCGLTKENAEWCRSDEIGQSLQHLPAILSFGDFQAQVACSGVAVEPDLIATTAHCVLRAEGLVVAGYTEPVPAPAHLAGSLCFPAASVFEMTRLGDINNNKDLAFIRVRPLVPGRALTPAPVCTAGFPPEGDPSEEVYLRGHPLGLPQFLSDKGQILERTDYAIRTSLDAFDGHSGGPIFSSSRHCVAALHRASSTTNPPREKCCRFVSTTRRRPIPGTSPSDRSDGINLFRSMFSADAQGEK